MLLSRLMHSLKRDTCTDRIRPFQLPFFQNRHFTLTRPLSRNQRDVIQTSQYNVCVGGVFKPFSSVSVQGETKVDQDRDPGEPEENTGPKFLFVRPGTNYLSFKPVSMSFVSVQIRGLSPGRTGIEFMHPRSRFDLV